MQQGVSWIHEHMQALASINIGPYRATSSSVQMIQDLRHVKAFLPPQEVY
jgi:hypothetical protein